MHYTGHVRLVELHLAREAELAGHDRRIPVRPGMAIRFTPLSAPDGQAATKRGPPAQA